MILDQLRGLLDRPIAFYKIFVELTGSVTAALMLSQAYYWSKRTKDSNGWFYKTTDEWREETGLTRHEQASARRALRKLGFWKEKLKRVPATTHYRLDTEILQASLPLPGKLGSREIANKPDGVTQSITETTPEITSSSTTNVVDESSIYFEFFERRKEEFKNSMLQIGGPIYTSQMLNSFIEYWAEPNGNRSQKMKWEVIKSKSGWDAKRRMTTWASKNLENIQCFLTGNEKTVAQKKHAFAISMQVHIDKYTPEIMNGFYTYWTQPENKPNPERLRWESEEFWNVGQRLSQWASRSPTMRSSNP